MRLLVVLNTHNRLELTKQTIESFRKTCTVPYFLVVVDNDSTDGTKEYLMDLQNNYTIDLLLLEPNLYPGKATNMGWQVGLAVYDGATHLMRVDNDMEFTGEWCKMAKDAFRDWPELGQLGLMSQHQEEAYTFHLRPERKHLTTLNFGWGNIGGTCIIPKELYDKGLRYDARKWYTDGGPTPQEDCLFSLRVKEMGYRFANLMEPVVTHLGGKDNHDKYPEYYKRTHEERGYTI